MQNKLSDLNNHLFAQLERLSDEDIKGEKLKEEIARARAIKEISGAIVENAKVALEGQKFIADYGGVRVDPVLPEMLEANGKTSKMD